MDNKPLLTFSLIITSFFLNACINSTSLLGSWHDEDYVVQSEPLKVLILGLFPDEFKREEYETEFVAQVTSEGRNQAVAGYNFIKDQSGYDNLSNIDAAIISSEADYLLIPRFKNAGEQQRYIPPSVTYTGGSYYYASYFVPGYTITETLVQLETFIFSVKDQSLIWSGLTESVNATSGKDIIEGLVKVVTKDMRKNGLIK